MIKTLIAFLLGVWLSAWIMSEYKSPEQISVIQDMFVKNLELATENIQLANKCKLN
jgi:hypothetical protein